MRSNATLWARIRPHRETLALALILMLAAFFRFWQLRSIPPGFHYDEAYEALEAWRVLTQRGYHPVFFAGNFGVEPMFIYLTSLAFMLFGLTPAVMRGVAAVMGTLTVAALYGLGQELARADDRIPPVSPLLAALVLAAMRWHVLFSRVGIEPVLVPFFLVLSLWALWRALRIGTPWSWLILGLVTGLSLYTYPAGRLVPLVVAVAIMAIALGDRGRLSRGIGDRSGSRDAYTQCTGGVTVPPRGGGLLFLPRGRSAGQWPGILLAGGVAVLIAAPLLVNFARHPDQLLLRSSQIAVEAEGAARGSLAGNLLAALGMFSLRGDRDPRSNIPGMPALDPLMSIVFLVGLGLAIWHWRRPVFSNLLLGGLIMLAPTILSEYAPHFRRALGTTPVVAMLCGLGLAAMLGRPGEGKSAQVPWRLKETGLPTAELAAGMDRLRALGRIIIVATILAGSTVLSAAAYFGRWGRDAALYYAYDQGLWEIGQYALGLPKGEPILITPRPATDATLAFAFRDGPPVRHFDGRHAFVIPSVTSGEASPATYIIIEHEDFRATHLLRGLFPEATEVRSFLDRDGEVYARAFRVPDTRSPSRQPGYPTGGRWPGLELVGYDLNQRTFRPGDTIYLQLWWRAHKPIERDWTVFTHVLGPRRPDGTTLWAGDDSPPGRGSLPTTDWSPGDLVLDEYQIRLPDDMPPGEYPLEVGLYDPARGGERAILELSPGVADPAGQDSLLLPSIRVQ